jgi:hypothetical protein
MGIDWALAVVTQNGDVFGANVVGRAIGPLFQFAGERR